ncbi:hypothetical protein ACU4GR_25730 [Methylobacterium oryzae CBMB20]
MPLIESTLSTPGVAFAWALIRCITASVRSFEAPSGSWAPMRT